MDWEPLLSRMPPCPAPALGLAFVPLEGPVVEFCAGVESFQTRDPVTKAHYWDLASLTKTMFTLPQIIKQLAATSLNTSTRLADAWPLASDSYYGEMPLFRMLDHSAGLPSDLPVEAIADLSAEEIFQAILEEFPRPGRRYSDLGYMLLGGALEYQASSTLSEIAEGWPYIETAKSAAGEPFVATEFDPLRMVFLQGETHDEKARLFPGQIAGHAGGFAKLSQAAMFVRWVLQGNDPLARSIMPVPPTGEDRVSERPRFGLGFRFRDSRFGGSDATPEGFGATGFVGNQIWIEPKRGYGVVVLSNRVHPRRGPREAHNKWCFELLDQVARRHC